MKGWPGEKLRACSPLHAFRSRHAWDPRLGLGHDMLNLCVDTVGFAANFMAEIVPLETVQRKLENSTASSEHRQELVDEKNQVEGDLYEIGRWLRKRHTRHFCGRKRVS
jgi:hypothetical protein